MKKYLKLLAAVMFITLFDGCETTNPDGPDTDSRDQFVGTWRFVETPASRSVNVVVFDVNITKDPSNSSQVLLSNFSGSGASAYGIVTTNKITVPSQTLSSNWLVNGIGNLSNSSTMNWTYFYNDGTDKYDLKAVATLQ